MADNTIKKIRETFELDVIDNQYFSWGEQHWLQLDPDNTGVQPAVSVAVAYPKEEYRPHLHSGYIEIVIGLEGQTVHWCDDREIRLEKGKIGYISDGSMHRHLNDTNEQASFLSIVYSIFPQSFRELSTVEDIELTELSKIINLDAIAEKFAKTVNMAVTLIDAAGNFMTDTATLPDLCQICILKKSGDCILNTFSQIKACTGMKVFNCKFGVATIQNPIIINNQVLGFLGCGYGNLSYDFHTEEFSASAGISASQALAAYQNLCFLNRNQLVAAVETLALVSTSMVQLMINSLKEKQLNNYRVRLSEEREMQARLHNSLNEARLKFLESQVNPHFLFNTLNTIAQQAEMDGSATSASLTYALSNLLRLSLGKTASLICVEDELRYVKDYLFIQKTRFPRKFDIDIEIDPDILKIKIPFMTIMVLIENAILHGFKNIHGQGLLCVRGYKQENRGVIEVYDNGCGMPDFIIEAVRELPDIGDEPPRLEGLGLKNTFLRLKHYYGETFYLTIDKPPEGGTLVQIVLPLNFFAS